MYLCINLINNNYISNRRLRRTRTMNKFLNNEWVCDYLSCITRQEVTFVREYTVLSTNPEIGEGVMKVFSSGDYTFNIYYLGNNIYLRENGKKIKIHSMSEFDRVIESQIAEHYQI